MNRRSEFPSIAILLCLATVISISVFAMPSKQNKRSKAGSHAAPLAVAEDIHSYSNPAQVRVTHVELDLTVLFDQKILKGAATLNLERATADAGHSLILDTRELDITKTEASVDGKTFSATGHSVGKADQILGAPLTVELPEQATRVRIEYATSPRASGLQWLEPSQTAGKKQPFMFTQSQAIHARSWIPLQDSPQVRVTYTARIRTPRSLLAVMSAENDLRAPRDGDYSVRMTHAIPPYLIALAVGDLAFKPLSRRTGVYAEPSVVGGAATEFADTEKMVAATEKLYGPYRWGRYDLLVLPPSFPFGGMENPRLTFATPTILAGDRSLVSLVAHELAHSWSGNLVTNATWSDFWLNEGFTTYLERRIIEALYGRPREEMEAVLGRQDLQHEIDTLDERDEILHIELKGRDPDEGSTKVPYEKGALFLRHLEETFGRARFDQFLRGYFDHFAFQSITTADFEAYLKKNLLDKYPDLAARVPVEEWIHKPGVPANAPRPASDAFSSVERQAEGWLRGEIPASKISTAAWSTHEWLHFLRHLPAEPARGKMEELDKAFNLTRTGNAEIAHQWLLMAIRNGYEAAYPRLEEYLTAIGRRKLIRPLYQELAKTPEGCKRALAIYQKARPGYHPIAVASIDEDLKKCEKK
jgi:leukotriene-A4 hydrolase